MTLQSVTLSSLQPPAHNPRKLIDADGIEGLAASIKADGLLQNLVVVPAKGSRFRIISGERRYRALKLLAERGDIGADFAVPVEVRKKLGKDDALRLATVENLQREDMHPLDAGAALAALIRKGATLDDLAVRTGLSTTTIKRRLALNTLCDEARTALADETISLAQAQALTLGGPEGQRAVLEEIESGRDRLDADDIRDHFLDDRVPVAAAIFARERYTGSLTTDLFQDDATSYFDDTEQFMALQAEAVEALAAQHRETAAWVDVTHTHRPPTWQYDEVAPGEPGGVLINLAPNGRVEIVEGLARCAELDEDTADEAAEMPLAPVLKRRVSVPAPLCRVIARHKTLAVQEVLLASPRKAREIAALRQLMAFKPHGAWREAAKAAESGIAYAALDAQLRIVASQLGLEDADEGWQALDGSCLDDGDLYERLKSLSDADIERLLTLLAVVPFGQANGDRLDTGGSLFNAIAQDLAIDMRNHWRPDADYLGRLTRPQLVAVAQECGFSDGHSALHAWKKAELVNGLLRHFELARSAPAPTPAQEKARAWLPSTMRFPAVDPGAPADAAGEVADDDVDAA